MNYLLPVYERIIEYSKTQHFNTQLNFPQDIYSIGYWIVAWFFINQGVHRLIAKPLGIKMFPAPAKGSSKKYLVERNKLHSAVWKFCYFTSCATAGFYLISTEEWFFSPRDYYYGWPNHRMSDAIKLYYNSQMGGYLFALLMMPFEPAQKVSDYIALLIHHFVTLALLYLSYTWGFFRIGIVIAFLHDISDPFMEMAKISLYSGKNWLADILFGMFALVFIVTRNFIYPYYVILSIHRYAYFPDGSKLPSEDVNSQFQIFLWLLEVLHIYWGGLILKMAYKAIVEKGVKDDIRNKNKTE